MKHDVEQASASNTEEDKASSPNKKKGIDVVSTSGVDKDINNESKEEDKTLLPFWMYIDPYERMSPRQRIVEEMHGKMRSLTSQENRAEYCICKVPNSLRKVKHEAYTPLLISIGPLHHDNKRLKAMQAVQEEKWRYFKEFTGQEKEKIRSLVSIIKEKIEDIKVCYSVKLDARWNVEDLIEMILLDAVFIIMFLKDLKDDRSNQGSRMIFDIQEDLMLLENQLPFFIIKEIYDEFNDAADSTWLDLTTSYLKKKGVKNNQSAEGSKHFTDLVRNSTLDKGIGVLRDSMLDRGIVVQRDIIERKFSAVMLRKAGVKFKVSQDKCLVNIKFEKGVLKMPQLEVNYCFERFVRNMMAFEQCFEPSNAYICYYINFLDNLINSAEDVDLLVENGILLHWLGDNAAVSGMINKLCENINDTYTCYEDIYREMNDHYENSWNHRKATLKLVYFPNIWRGTGTVAAAILLILTLIQTISSAKSLF